MKEKTEETRRIHNHKTCDKAGEARERNVYRTSIGDVEQLARLNARLGVGVGAKRERARLEARL